LHVNLKNRIITAFVPDELLDSEFENTGRSAATALFWSSAARRCFGFVSYAKPQSPDSLGIS
jgi:hypothetical protein